MDASPDRHRPEHRDGLDDLTVWRIDAPLGLLLVGAGVATAIDAATRRAGGSGVLRWAGQGTVGLTLINAGLSVFGEAVKRRAVHETKALLADAATGPGTDDDAGTHPLDGRAPARVVDLSGRPGPAGRRPGRGGHSSW
ncbi:hypothetical protein ACFFKU_16275 [Kineococcus gynurae]|uniref:Uncharacterized protein n=1 Tax=Kineococcus gynurae TaxID=452979 RepID=A0ABV5LPM1_9ACTN